jgi:hypothetical protein
LNSGRNDHYAVVTPSIEDNAPEFLTPTVYVVPWKTKIEVWQYYTDEGTTQTNLYGYVQNIISQIQKNKTLGDTTNTIHNAEIIGISQPLEMHTEGGGPVWLKQELTVQWHEENAVTFA